MSGEAAVPRRRMAARRALAEAVSHPRGTTNWAERRLVLNFFAGRYVRYTPPASWLLVTRFNSFCGI